MNIFLFQTNPTTLDLRSAIQHGKQEPWYATRYQSDMKPGDLVFLWMSGDEYFQGLYGWGRIASEPYSMPNWLSHAVDVKYEVRFERPLKATLLEKDPIVSSMLVFRSPNASNFLLDRKVARQIIRMIRERNETAPDLPETNK